MIARIVKSLAGKCGMRVDALQHVNQCSLPMRVAPKAVQIALEAPEAAGRARRPLVKALSLSSRLSWGGVLSLHRVGRAKCVTFSNLL